MFKLWVLMLFLCSCTVGKDYKRPEIYSDEVIKKELGLNKQYPLVQKWYDDLGDKNLTALVDKGLAQSPDVETAIARLKQARLLSPQALAKLAKLFQTGRTANRSQ